MSRFTVRLFGNLGDAESWFLELTFGLSLAIIVARISGLV